MNGNASPNAARDRLILKLMLALVALVTVASLRQLGGGVAQAPSHGLTFAQRRAAHPTKLLRHGPSPQKYEQGPPPAGVQAVTYTSGPLELKAWFQVPPGAGQLGPAVVYFHGGFAFGLEDWQSAQPFLDAGISVLMPMLRGENGNPGDYELMFGEQDDALAAIAWVAAQDRVDPTRIYTFGHSVGGGLSALVPLSAKPSQVRLTASAGGLYDDLVFASWARNGIAPFDPGDPDEMSLRLLEHNLGDMHVPHIVYIGNDDSLRVLADPIRQAAERIHAPLRIVMVPGDHGGSLDPAIREFVKEIRAN